MPDTFLPSDWWTEFTWAKYDPVSWQNNMALYAIARKLKARTTLEIGIGQQPNGIYWLGHHAQEVGGRHFAIDVVPGNCKRAFYVIDKFGLENVEVVPGNSNEIPWKEYIDLLYIDGGHDYQTVFSDWMNFAMWLNPRGVIIFDDYGKKHLEVTQAVNAIMEIETMEYGKYEWFHIPEWWMLCRLKR